MKLKIYITILKTVYLYYLVNDSNNTTFTQKMGGVYKIPCNSCNSVYIGETIKSLQTRVEQHKADVRRCNTNNAIFLHITNNHKINWNDAAVLFSSKSKNLNRFIEAFFIKTLDNFNTSSGFFLILTQIGRASCRERV